ncbi:hypothetical protein [Listeria floridensis]|uniref:hypothetical protein n=1 Tax=Listeria floridensis TaxID=1494962 RepID=UPI0004BC4FC3|nr:hypothetical protein [Listeria floridensis]
MAFGGVARGIGALASTASSGINVISRLKLAFQGGNTAAKMLESGMSLTDIATSRVGRSALQSAGSIKGLKSGADVASSGLQSIVLNSGKAGLSLARFVPAIAGVTAAVGLGYAAWKIWGEKVWDASQRTKRWGSDVGEQTDQTLQKVQNLKTQAVGDFELMASGIGGSSDKVVKSFEKIGSSLEKDIKKRIEATTKALKDIPDYAQKPVEDALKKEEEKIQKTLQVIQNNNNKVLEIKAKAKKR